MPAVTRDADHAHARALPKVLVLELGDGHVEVSAQPVFQAAQDLAFVLEGLRVGDLNFQGEEANRHFRPP